MSETELRFHARLNNLPFTYSTSSNDLVQILEEHTKAQEEEKQQRKSDEELFNTIRAQNKKMKDIHRSVRITELRQQSNPNPEHLEYPFEFLDEKYEFDLTPKSIPGHTSADIGDFPNNIEHYYWIHQGENDEEPWMTLCRLTNGAYVFYKGECDYTGFDCQGSMEIYSSIDPAILITYAMSIRDYDVYIVETQCEKN